MTYLNVNRLGWLAFIFILFTNCNHPIFDLSARKSGTYKDIKAAQRDLNEIIASGKLVALTDNSSTSFFIYKGEPMGFEYELLKLYTDYLGIELEIKIVDDLNEILKRLQKGEGDIVAANMTVTKERSKSIQFTEHHLLTRQVLIQKLPDNSQKLTTTELDKKLIRNPIDLINKDVYVRKNSSFYNRLIHLSDEIGGNINIIETPGDYETEQLITMVSEGQIPMTVADENVAMNNKTYHNGIDIKTAISFPQKIAWAIRPNSTNLLYSVNTWIGEMRNNSTYAYIFKKYFESPKDQKERVSNQYSSIAGNNISRFDILIKNRSKLLNWDWRLLASLIQQESRFKANAVSWAGARGLMQLMPKTAQQFGVYNLSNPAENIKAGTLYLAWLDQFWCAKIPNEKERIHFILASYNAGIGHIMDARKLAKKYGSNPDVWKHNVEDYIRLKSKSTYYNDEVVNHGYCRGAETYDYVRKIISRYEYYKSVII